MLYVKETAKDVAQAVADLERSVAKHGFGLLHSYDFRKTLGEKGFPLANECRVLEICNPGQASRILQQDMTLNMALPCRVSVYQEAGQDEDRHDHADRVARARVPLGRPAGAGRRGGAHRCENIIDDAV